MFSLSVWGFYWLQFSRSPAKGDHEKSTSFLLTSYVGWIKVRISAFEEMDPVLVYGQIQVRGACVKEKYLFSFPQT